MDIAVIGGGHGSHAAAADLSLQGHQVRFWRRDHQAFAPILKQQTIELTDASGQRSVPLALATTELKAAVRGAKLVLVPLPATAHAGLVEALIDCLEDEQVVLMPPGTFGSYFFARALEAARPGARVMFAESGTLPYLTRLQTPTRVAIRVRATRLPTGVFPAEKREQAYQVIREAYPAVEPLADALDGALMNAGPIIHPPLIVLNAGAIEYFRGLNPGWDIHKEGT
ncbi:MAG: 2-dehydropantoate 2-reductase N-terminal domain-containing protein, partial [Pseudomonadota bacterium]